MWVFALRSLWPTFLENGSRSFLRPQRCCSICNFTSVTITVHAHRSFCENYRIRLDYRTVRLKFFKITGKTRGKICILYTKDTLKKWSAELSNEAYRMVLSGFVFLIFFIKAWVVGSHLNCIDKSMQFRWELTTYAFMKKVDKSTLTVIQRLWNCLTVHL